MATYEKKRKKRDRENLILAEEIEKFYGKVIVIIKIKKRMVVLLVQVLLLDFLMRMLQLHNPMTTEYVIYFFNFFFLFCCQKNILKSQYLYKVQTDYMLSKISTFFAFIHFS